MEVSTFNKRCSERKSAVDELTKAEAVSIVIMGVLVAHVLIQLIEVTISEFIKLFVRPEKNRKGEKDELGNTLREELTTITKTMREIWEEEVSLLVTISGDSIAFVVDNSARPYYRITTPEGTEFETESDGLVLRATFPSLQVAGNYNLVFPMYYHAENDDVRENLEFPDDPEY